MISVHAFIDIDQAYICFSSSKCLFEGFGVFTTQQFTKGSFPLEYVGERITPKEADEKWSLLCILF